MKHLFTVCYLLLAQYCYAEGATITGKFAVKAGDTESYTVSWSEWDNFYENNANVSWIITGGTILSQDKHSVTIYWDVPSGYLNTVGKIEVYEDLGAQDTERQVTIENHTEGGSELCNGVLGPTVIYENFGSGPNPGTTLPPGVTTYFYNGGCGLTPGEYTRRTNTMNCRSLWHNIPSDHTGNPNGYLMMINADDNRGVIYAKTFPLPTTAYRYEFSAWVGNLYNTTAFGQNPIIRFEVYDENGNQIGSSGSITIPATIPFQWQKVGFMFNFPIIITGNITVLMVNTRPNTADSGNDMVVDDISFAPCYPPIIASFSATTQVNTEHICNTGTVNLYGRWPSIIPLTNPAYQWQRSTDNGTTWADIAGANNVNHTITEPLPGVYAYRIRSYETANPSRFLLSNTITYYVQKMIVDARTEKIYTCNGSVPSVKFVATYKLQYSDPEEASLLTYSFLWSPATYINNTVANPANIRLPVPPIPSPTGPPLGAITYNFNVNVTNNNHGCTASNIQTVIVQRPRKVFLANAFTPNNDGVNDYFTPRNLGDYPGSEFEIYNRWGNRIFFSKGPTDMDYRWDGKYNGAWQEPTNYVWRVKIVGCPTNLYGATNGDGVPYGNVLLLY